MPENKKSQRGDKQSQRSSQSSDIKQREYTDSHGDVHHHTKKFMEQQGSKKDKED